MKLITLLALSATFANALQPTARFTVPASSTTSRLLALRGGATAPSFSEAVPFAGAVALHGLCLAGCGYQAQSTLGMGAAVLLAASAGLSVSGNFPAYMAGVHIALLLQAGSAATFGVQAVRFGLAQTGAKFLPYAVMASSSVGALMAEQKLKPKKKPTAGKK